MEIGRTNQSKGHRQRGAFTLIELILVMTIMVVIISLVMPSLKGFFQGRNLDNEALRFLALTRYGQSRAINEGVPVELWVNPKARHLRAGGAVGLHRNPDQSGDLHPGLRRCKSPFPRPPR